MKIAFLTGTDASMFGQVLLLLQSFEDVGAGGALTICDFGLNQRQRRFLEARYRLAVRPAATEDGQHAWYQKASLLDFAVGGPDAVVWIDADMIVTRDPRPLISEILAEMSRDGHCVAVCRDDTGFDLDQFLQWTANDGRKCVRFAELIESRNVSAQCPYLNSGFFIVTLRPWLEAWKATAFEIGRELLFEQNAFNVVAWRRPDSVRILDARQWNVHGSALGRTVVDDRGTGLLCDDMSVVILHAASTKENTPVHQKTVDFVLGSTPASVPLRLFRHPRLSEIQLNLFRRFLARNESEMAKYFLD
jgi:hypothetical protein